MQASFVAKLDALVADKQIDLSEVQEEMMGEDIAFPIFLFYVFSPFCSLYSNCICTRDIGICCFYISDKIEGMDVDLEAEGRQPQHALTRWRSTGARVALNIREGARRLGLEGEPVSEDRAADIILSVSTFSIPLF